jgi:putative acetyltransferase
MREPELIVAEATTADHETILALNRAAFGGEEEAEIIEKLERDRLVVLSLVARADDGEVVGHILFSVLDVVANGRRVKSLALAPMAVRPKRQRGGIGSALIREGLQRLKDAGWEAVFVLGHTDYYPRFGFSARLARNFVSPFAELDAFMALELVPGVLGKGGTVRYPPVWGLQA